MVRSEPASAQNAPVNGVNNIQSPPPEVLASFQIERTGQQVRIVDADGSAYEGQVVGPELFSSLQAARQATGAGAPAGAASPALESAFSSNFQAQSNGNPQVQSPAGQLPPRTAIVNAGRDQVSSSATEGSQLAGPQSEGDGSGFAFQVSGLNLKLNQSVTITGNCVAAPLPAGGYLAGGNLSNQSQAMAGATMRNSQTPSLPPPGGQAQALFGNSNVNNRNTQNTQDAAPAGQFWRVTGQVQIGPANRFDLDAATSLP
jgi:hypothetical protein